MQTRYNPKGGPEVNLFSIQHGHYTTINYNSYFAKSAELRQLIDHEITSVNDWENWLSRNHEMLKGKLKIIVSSSRSNLIFPAKSLRGRILSNELYPLSFKEFLNFKK